MLTMGQLSSLGVMPLVEVPFVGLVCQKKPWTFCGICPNPCNINCYHLQDPHAVVWTSFLPKEMETVPAECTVQWSGKFQEVWMVCCQNKHYLQLQHLITLPVSSYRWPIIPLSQWWSDRWASSSMEKQLQPNQMACYTQWVHCFQATWHLLIFFLSLQFCTSVFLWHLLERQWMFQWMVVNQRSQQSCVSQIPFLLLELLAPPICCFYCMVLEWANFLLLAVATLYLEQILWPAPLFLWSR